MHIYIHVYLHMYIQLYTHVNDEIGRFMYLTRSSAYLTRSSAYLTGPFADTSILAWLACRSERARGRESERERARERDTEGRAAYQTFRC